MKNALKVSYFVAAGLCLSACIPGGGSSSSIATSVSSSNSSSSAVSSSSKATTESRLVLAVNAGGTASATYEAVQYQPDAYSTGGTANSTADAIAGVSAGSPFQSERYGTYTYEIPVTDGSYDIKLLFAEIYHTQASKRSVNVDIEGRPQIQALDIYGESGHDKPYTYTAQGVAVSDGSLTISIQGAIGDGTLSGFAIYSKDGELAKPKPPVAGVPTKENTGNDCTVPALAAPAQLPKNSKLPDPFIKLDGTRMTKRSEWHCRRQEIHKQAEKYIYGVKPPKPEVVTGSVTNSKINVHVEYGGKKIDFSADIVLPSTGSAPYPAIINLGAKGGFGGITLGESRILNQGVAIIYYNHYDLGKEGVAEQSRGKPNPGKFYDLYGGNHSAGLLMSWAWGASRMLDVIEQYGSSIISPTSIGVTGCSRNGKGAFAVGVFDERIALTIPHETSTAGVPAYRIVDVLNTERTDHNFKGLNWLSNDFEPFVLNAAQLPIDSHTIIGMIAPRGLLILENPHQRQMSAPAGHTAAVAGAEIYKALGVESNISYHSKVSETPHCSYKNEYTTILTQNISKFLKHESAQTGKFEVGSGGSLTLSDWKDWVAPTLLNDTEGAN